MPLDSIGDPPQRTFYDNHKGHVEGLFLCGSDRPHISGNIPAFCGGILYKKLESFRKGRTHDLLKLIQAHVAGDTDQAEGQPSLR